MRVTMTWGNVRVDGRNVSHGVAGSGPPVVFLHGWGLSHHTYRHGLERLAGRGFRVVAPGLPGFGGTTGLPPGSFSLEGYAAWTGAFLRELGITEPVVLVGHSFGGGVALRVAHDHPEAVARLILVDPIGGPVWSQRGELPVPMADRPVWDWGLHLAAHAFALRSFARVVPAVAAAALPNLVLHPGTFWRVGRLARDADLRRELEQLKRRRAPVAILWGSSDRLIPWACVESLAVALGQPEVVRVPGDHSWLLADPGRFAETVTAVLAAAPRPTRSRAS